MNRIQKELIAELSIDDIPVGHRPLVELIGLEKFILLCDYARGDSLYFPQVSRIIAPARDRKSERNIMDIIKESLLTSII